jgi:hypothetical protein
MHDKETRTMNRQTRGRTLAVLAAGSVLALAGPANALAAPTAHSADLLGGLTGAVQGVTGGGSTGSAVPAPVASVVPAVTNLLGSTNQGGAPTAVVVSTVNSLLGGTSTPPAPTPASLVGTVTGAVGSLQQGNPAGVQDALAGTLSSLVGSAANIPNPDAVTSDLQAAVAALLAGDQQTAVARLTDLVGQLVGLSGGVLPTDVTSGVQAAVTALLHGDVAGVVNGLGQAVSAAVAAQPAGGAGDGSVASFDLPGATGAIGSAVGPVLGGTGLLAPGKLYFAVSQVHTATAGSPRLVVRGARLVEHGARVRVKVSCIGLPSQTCAGVVRIRQLSKTIAHSAQLKLAGGQTKKVLLKVAGHHAKKTAKKAKRH